MPSKTIEDFAYQVRDYMRSAEVVEGKNLLDIFKAKTRTNGITTTKNSDGSCLVDGTTTASWQLIDSPELNCVCYNLLPNTEYVASYGDTAISALNIGVVYTTDGTNWINITSTSTDPYLVFTTPASFTNIWVQFAISNGVQINNETIYPMICTKKEWDRSHTYEPYYVPVKDSKLSIKDQQVLGAWNLLPNNQIIQELYGVTFTVNDDKSVSLSGTMASNAPVIYGTCITNYKLPAGRYLLSGAPKGGSKSTYHSLVNIKHSDNTTTPNWDTGDGVWFDIVDGDTISVYAPRVDTGFRGQSTNGLVWHPQITKEPNQPYAPYAMTNKELTDDIVPLISNVSELLKMAFRFVLPNQAKTKVTIKNAKYQTILLFIFGQYSGRKQGLFAIARMFDDSISAVPYFNDGIVIGTNMILENVGTNDLDIKFPTFTGGSMGYGFFITPNINSSIETGTYE